MELTRPTVILLTPRRVLADLLVAALARAFGIADVQVAATGRDMLRLARRRHGAVCVVDPAHPAEDVFAAARRLPPRAGLIFLADSAPCGWVRRALATGRPAAYLGGGATLDDVIRAVSAVRQGQSYYSPCAADAIGRMARGGDGFTARGLQILTLLCRGARSKEIARALGLSTKTIDAHRAALMRRIGVHSAAALVRYACAERLVDAGPLTVPRARRSPRARRRRA